MLITGNVGNMCCLMSNDNPRLPVFIPILIYYSHRVHDTYRSPNP